ncbi:alkaline phosphatase [Flavilitoribacter nigricans]|nr:alkaline phosphatase [Flavilitoribacter nigricans]
MIHRLLSFLLVFLVWSCTSRQPALNTAAVAEPAPATSEVKLEKHPKNIILMIGDGMGITQITAGMYSNGNRLYLEEFPIVGLHKPYSSSNLITDSAAGATAFASGVKTYNGAIGVSPDTSAARTILEEAEEQGLATGLLATSTIVHATPAAFIAHTSSRNNMEDIAKSFLETEIDLFIGGGKKYFTERKDGRNLLEELKQKGYYVSDYSEEGVTELVMDYSKNLAYLTDRTDPKPQSKGRDFLRPAAMAATYFLDNRSPDKGFFLMIEGAQIDWGGHANSSNYIISEMIDFDETIGAVLDFAKEDGETLIIVTADHETGGFAINPGSTMEKIKPGFTTDYHTGTLIPVFAYGPGSSLFSGIYENTAIYQKMKTAFGFTDQ